jgi:hypothetical protein
MNAWFELWDSESSNLVGSYRTDADALAIVRRALATHGAVAVSGLVLVQDDGTGADPRVIAAGSELVDLVRILRFETRDEASAFTF